MKIKDHAVIIEPFGDLVFEIEGALLDDVQAVMRLQLKGFTKTEAKQYLRLLPVYEEIDDVYDVMRVRNCPTVGEYLKPKKLR